MTDQSPEPVVVVPQQIEAFRAWYFQHTGKRIFASNAEKAVRAVLAAAPASPDPLLEEARAEIERLRAGLEEIVCWFGEAPTTFPNWKVTAEALADMAQNILAGHPALSSPESRAFLAKLGRA